MALAQLDQLIGCFHALIGNRKGATGDPYRPRKESGMTDICTLAYAELSTRIWGCPIQHIVSNKYYPHIFSTYRSPCLSMISHTLVLLYSSI
jgi:hypothetical protein